MSLAAVEQPDICSLCGNTFDPAAELRFDDDSQVLVVRGKAFYFRRGHWLVLKAMLDKMAKAVRHAEFYELQWPGGMDEPKNPRRGLEVQICLLRRRLRGTGLWINTHEDVGYSIIFLAKAGAA